MKIKAFIAGPDPQPYTSRFDNFSKVVKSTSAPALSLIEVTTPIKVVIAGPDPQSPEHLHSAPSQHC